jgi:XTP/dITP diphosphohydrolase
MKTLILASHNLGKRDELQAVLQDFPYVIQNAPDDWPEVDETGLTFVENAILKARSAAEHTGLPALADDSGIVVPALNGAPGIYSARYAGEKANAQDNINKLLHDMLDIPETHRQAYFYCCLVFMRHKDDQIPIIAQGMWPGIILRSPQGSNGFGYDPIVWIPETQCSAAELSDSEKSRLIHRARAAAELKNKL